jgi:alcohol dehydrogenase
MAMAELSKAGDSTTAARLPADWALAGFDQQPRTRLVFGNGSLARLGELLKELGVRRALLVTDPGLIRAGHAERTRAIIERAGIATAVFDRVRENPDTADVAACVEAATAFEPDGLVGLGGGSSMDTAKGCNFIHTNGGRIHDYWGVGKARRPMLPFIAIPTTAGTGSECQSSALIADAASHMKMACLDPKAAARVAILDPELTVSQPRKVTAVTGIDALSHAVESAVTTRRNAISWMYSQEAFRLLVPGLPRVLEVPHDLEARGRMLLGAALAGTAIELSMLGATHAAANPLTAHFGVIHGHAVGLMLPHVVRYNSQDPAVSRAYAELASAAEIACVSDGLATATSALVQHLEQLLDVAGIPRSLSEAGADADLIPTLANEAARQWTASFNPRALNAEDFVALYRQALNPR